MMSTNMTTSQSKEERGAQILPGEEETRRRQTRLRRATAEMRRSLHLSLMGPDMTVTWWTCWRGT